MQVIITISDDVLDELVREDRGDTDSLDDAERTVLDRLERGFYPVSTFLRDNIIFKD